MVRSLPLRLHAQVAPPSGHLNREGTDSHHSFSRISPSNMPTRAPAPHQHTSARNADFHDPRTCCFQGGSTRPASLMEFSPRSPCSSTSQASTGPLLPSYPPRALTSFPACSGYDVGFLLCAGGLLLLQPRDTSGSHTPNPTPVAWQ